MKQPSDRDPEAPEAALGHPPGEEPEPPDEGDFADEHTDVTFADEQAGGLEGEEETESPEGYSGFEPS